MATKLFVGRLSYSTTDDSLLAAFSQYGTVSSAQVIKDRDSGQSKGFAFVEFDDDAAAKAAIAGLDGKELDGRTIAVSEARPRENRENRSFGGGSRPSNGPRNNFQKRY